jgi:hypothetical protein
VRGKRAVDLLAPLLPPARHRSATGAEGLTVERLWKPKSRPRVVTPLGEVENA